MTFQRSEQMATAVTNAVHDVLPDADVVVHSVPRQLSTENIFDRVRAVATRYNLNVHDVSVQDLLGQLHVEQHLELDENLSLKEAHDRVTMLESEIREEVPEISSIITHIESEPATIEPGDELIHDAKLESRLKVVASEFPEILDMHDIQIKRVRGRIYVSAHCTMADDLPLSRVHDVSTDLEIRFKQEFPELFRVLIAPRAQHRQPEIVPELVRFGDNSFCQLKPANRRWATSTSLLPLFAGESLPAWDAPLLQAGFPDCTRCGQSIR